MRLLCFSKHSIRGLFLGFPAVSCQYLKPGRSSEIAFGKIVGSMCPRADDATTSPSQARLKGNLCEDVGSDLWEQHAPLQDGTNQA